MSNSAHAIGNGGIFNGTLRALGACLPLRSPEAEGIPRRPLPGRFCRVTRWGLLVLALAAFAVLLVASPAQAQSNTFVINSLDDTPDANTADGVCGTAGNCTLRAAIQQSNADAPNGPDEIDFGIPGQVNLTGPLPEITNSVNITGTTSRNTVFRGDGTGDYRIFTITNGSTVSIQNLTISNGLASGSSSPGNAGGGIYLDSGNTLNLTDSAITGNTARTGGGIWNFGTTNIKDSSIGLNFATVGDGRGGGIFTGVGANLSVVDSLFNFNRASTSGGGIFSFASNTSVDGSTFRNNIASGSGQFDGGGGIEYYLGPASVTNSTFIGNSANSASGGGILSIIDKPWRITNSTVAGNSASSGGGIYDFFANASLQNTLVARNTATGVSPDLGGASDFTSDGNNLIGDGSGSSGFTNGTNGDQVGSASNPIDPKLETDTTGTFSPPLLKDNGGPTQTIKLLPGSPAIDAGSDSVLDASDNLTTDQRGEGFPRKRGAHVDIGAFEVQNQPPVAQDQDVSTEEDKATQITLAATDPENDSLTYSVIQQPSHGALSGTGANLTYTPETNFNGADTFTYKANDGVNDSNTATVTITVKPVNVAQPPTATPPHHHKHRHHHGKDKGGHHGSGDVSQG